MRSLIHKSVPALSILFLLFTFACVPAKQFQELKEKQKQCEEDRKQLSSQNQSLETENNELKAELERLQKEFDDLTADAKETEESLNDLNRRYDRLEKINNELLAEQARASGNNKTENQKLMVELQEMQERLLKKEDELRKLEKELDKKKINLDRLSAELINRERRVKELEHIIAQQDSATNALKERITNALLGFKDKGLSIEQRNGKIYVSLEAKLLFAKGSTVVDAEGKKALIELAKAVADQQDLSILVEGHTDIDKMKSSTMKDNWDLSVLRATSVVRILVTDGKLNPKMLTAAGRGEFIPVDPGKTEAAKSKNRRIEVILTPNLDELFKILED